MKAATAAVESSSTAMKPAATAPVKSAPASSVGTAATAAVPAPLRERRTRRASQRNAGHKS